MTVEQLLMPRYKVIAKYPNSIYKIGALIHVYGEPGSEAQAHNVAWFNDFPNIFKKLEWWEDRPEDQLPKYLKEIETGNVVSVTHYFIDIKTPSFYTGEKEKSGRWKGLDTPFNLRAMLPATEEEYLNNKTQTQQ